MKNENKKYNIIYADPPWHFSRSMKSSGSGGSYLPLERHYRTKNTTLDELKLLRVNEITAKNAMCFMWSTDAHIKYAIEVMESWGFKYKTVGFYWIKKHRSGKQVCFMGAYTMKCGELCLLGTKGTATKLIKKPNIRALVESARGKHSVKPAEVRERISSFVGAVPKIELFAREKVKGWDVWGDEVESDIQLDTKERHEA